LVVFFHGTLFRVHANALNQQKWSQRTDLNRRPAVYETAALPLSYVGASHHDTAEGLIGPQTAKKLS
tara:strand:- start:357 stop:557 length:201 start_codon:yes stop_codon:yes gene_type:complete